MATSAFSHWQRALVLLAVTLPTLTAYAGHEVTDTADRLFVAEVRALLAEKCLACHGTDPANLKSSLDLRTRESALRGGESGEAAIVPGNPDESLLYQAVRWNGYEMPPKENDRLTNEQINLLRQWIEAGAPWAEEETWNEAADPAPATTSSPSWSASQGVGVETSGGLSPEWTNRRYREEGIWAFQPIRRPAVPDAAIDPKRVRNPIDAFIQERLAETGIMQLAEPADKLTFIRRATFDLLGLPPTPAEIAKFLNDQEPRARGRLVERLLADPRYGEQQARHWLDVVRYADTSGFSNDIERPNAWRYRDYVVRSFNVDKPYDRFVTEQVAGDELDPADPELLIAAGFLRMGPWEHTDMTPAAVTRQQFLDDVTHQVGVSLLGQGLRCASCHDHKFDPVPTRDYYRLQAVFAPVQFIERRVPFLLDENTANFAESRLAVLARIERIERLLSALKRKSDAAKTAYLTLRGVSRYQDLRAEQRPDGGNFGREFGLTTTEQSLQKIYEKSLHYFRRELDRFEPRALSVYAGPVNSYHSLRPVHTLPEKRNGVVPAVHVLAGGAIESPLDVVTPGVLSAMAGANDTKEPTAWNTVPDTMEGRRLVLAQWIASPNNTLTARVIVNRVWQQHFSRGIVATPNNFGVTGARPSHPELLDWLATWFTDHGWSIKRLHRLIMNSATYRQSGEHPHRKQVDEADSTHSLLAYFPSRRLAAEEIRDGVLAVTGELNPEMGGPGVFPEINWEVALQPRHIMGSVAPAYVPSRTPRERNRRTLYVFRYRTMSDPLLEVFNRPGSDISCERRDETTVTPQAFALLNSEFAQQRSLAFAVELIERFPQWEERISAAFLRTYGRPPTSAEIDLCREHYDHMLAHHREQVPRPVELPAYVERGMIEEFTGEMVHWKEELPLDGYVRDTMPWHASPEERALAEVCLVLLNSNEFLYVR